MGDVVAIPPGTHLSVRGFAEETGLARDTVAKRIKEAALAPSGKRGGHPVFRLKDLLKAAYFVSDDGSFDPDRLRPFERRAHYQAEHEKLSLERERAELIPRIEVEQEMARVAKIVARGLETLPDILERDCGATPAMVARLERHVDQVREDMHAAMIEDAAGAEAPGKG